MFAGRTQRTGGITTDLSRILTFLKDGGDVVCICSSATRKSEAGGSFELKIQGQSGQHREILSQHEQQT